MGNDESTMENWNKCSGVQITRIIHTKLKWDVDRTEFTPGMNYNVGICAAFRSEGGRGLRGTRNENDEIDASPGRKGRWKT